MIVHNLCKGLNAQKVGVNFMHGVRSKEVKFCNPAFHAVLLPD